MSPHEADLDYLFGKSKKGKQLKYNSSYVFISPFLEIICHYYMNFTKNS
jgi:hypothetical protein